jgi:hypothetical protein
MIFVVVIFVGNLVAKDLVLSGNISYQTSFSKPSAFFSDLVPLQRVKKEKQGMVITADPLYTTYSFPRPFRRAEATVEFTNDSNLFFEYGYQNGPGESFHLQAMNHPELNTLYDPKSNWTGKVDSDLTLYQKRSAPYIYASADQFYSTLPEQDRTGYYGVAFSQPYVPEQVTGKTKVTTPLRGSHQFYTVTNSKPLDLTFNFYDLNLASSIDDIVLTLESWDGEVLAKELVLDEREETIGLASKELSARFRVEGLDSGQVVKLRLESSTDIIVTEMNISSPYFVAQGSVWVAGGKEYHDDLGKESLSDIMVVTSARTIVASTPSRHTVQRVYIGPEALVIEKPMEQYTYTKSLSDNFPITQGYEIVSEKGNFQLQGRGVFAFSQDAYFSPFPWYIDDTLSLEEHSIQYLVTDYQPPAQLESGQFSNTITIDMEQAFLQGKSLRTQFSLPYVSASEPLILSSLQVEYFSDPVTVNNFVEKAQRFIKREFIN